MSITSWTDYHAWRVSATNMQAVQRVLHPDAWAALNILAETDGSYITPRYVIETFALAMPEQQACTWLESVYDLQAGEGASVLRAIKFARPEWGRKP